MTKAEFNRLKNFSVREKNPALDRLEEVEDFKLIEPELMHYVDALTSFIKEQFYERNPICRIHHITSGVHKKDSQHYLGRAVDCHFTGLSLYEMVMMGSLFPFTGVGFYPYSIPCFIHLDTKELNNQIIRRLWYRDHDDTYIGLDDMQEVIHKLRNRKICLQNGID